jgi:uncharacterized phage-associated protein
MLTASAVARYLILEFIRRKSPISHLKLQKLLYYAQGWHLGLYDKPLFNDRIEAWVHGPVLPSIFQEYRGYRWVNITGAEEPQVPKEIAAHLNEVADAYGDLTATQLERLSHTENPWKETRGDLDPSDRYSAEISHSLMREFFAAQEVNG